MTNALQPTLREVAAIASVRKQYEDGLLFHAEYEERVSQLQAA